MKTPITLIDYLMTIPSEERVPNLLEMASMPLSERNKKFFLHRKPYANLYKQLLSLGGKEVVFFQEVEDLKNIAKRGVEWPAKNAKLVKGEPNQCHRNSAMLWGKWLRTKGRSTVIFLVTGWTLNDDGLWRMHSWCWDDTKKIVLETTERRTRYFGYKLEYEESLSFALNNCAPL